MVSEFRFFKRKKKKKKMKKKKKKKMKKKKKKKNMDNLRKSCLPVFRTSYDIFIHTFSHVLHLDVLKSQIGLKLKVKTEISLCMAIMQNNPLPSLYTQYYRTV